MALLTAAAGFVHAIDVSTHVLGAKKQILDASTDTVKAGYYAAAKLSVVDSNLKAENIKSGVTIFGHAGTAAGGAGHDLPDTGQITSFASTFDDDADIVSGAQPSFTDNSNGTITDNRTGLMWVKDGLSAPGADSGLSWEDAGKYCQDLTFAAYTDWYLPNVRELMSIVNYQNINPTIDTGYFTTWNGPYWTSTTYMSGTGSAWKVYFNDGSVVATPKANGNFIRCVRVGPTASPSSPQSFAAIAGDRKITLTWSASSSDGGSAITNYKIYRGASSGSETYLTTVGNVLTYDNTSLTNGVPYYYKVSAVNAAGESGQSTEASATPAAPPAASCTVEGPTTIGGVPVYCDSSLRMWSPTADIGGAATTKAWGPTDETIGSCTGKGAGYPACNYCDTLNYAGLTGWTLPATDVLRGFWTAPCGSASCGSENPGVSWDTNAKSEPYWSSEDYDIDIASTVNFDDGSEYDFNGKDNTMYVRCVRSGS